MPGAKEAGQGQDPREEEALDERESMEVAQDPLGGGAVPIPGSAVGSTLEATLTEQLVLEGPPPCSPETPQLSSSPGAVLGVVRRDQAEREVLSCPEASPRLRQEGEDQEAEGEPEASVPAWDASETENSASFLSPISSRTRDLGRRQLSEVSDSPGSWLLASRAGVKTANRMSPVHGSSSGIDTPETPSKAPKGGLAKDRGMQGQGPVGEQPPKTTEATVCANNSKVSSTGEKVVLWTREADRVILTMCQARGAQPQTFSAISQQLGNKTPSEVSHRFRELMRLFHTACEASSEEEEDAASTSNADQLSDRGDLLSEEELDA